MSMVQKILIHLILLMFLQVSCSSTDLKNQHIISKDAPNLTETQAKQRASRVKNTSYDLIFDLSQKQTKYTGVSKINFDLTDKSSPLRIDFYGGEITSLKINNSTSIINYNNHYILVSKKDLLIGKNTVEINFTQKFSTDGSGFYRFVDSEDKRIYTYTNLEPFSANKVFPCFDQPNLKARYTVNVLAPSDWQVITSTLPSKIDSQTNYKKWTFPQSALFSTYIWSLHAGPYAMFTDKNAKYPSRVFMRQSMKRYIHIDDWFTFTRQSFEFLNDYFGYEYPYKKYDQLIVPDFNEGAMENVAAVTFSEGYISRGEKTVAMRRSLANVIFHEMAHMWFGNLVTMDWWNDLWLNESFATYMANLGLSQNTEFKDSAWPNFNRTKNWAYWEDQLITTHPIEAIVPDTKQAFANFDGITYGKGAASLKQIHYKLGDAQFKKGIQIYFKKHANMNTKLADFMSALENGSGIPLLSWQKSWLQTTGVNTVKAKFNCTNNKISHFSIAQNPSDKIRAHSFKLALLKENNKKMNIYKTYKVDLAKKEQVLTKLIGLPCPDLVYPNYEDHDYIRVALDQKTIDNIPKYVDKITDNFLRQLFFFSLWDMVYYGEYNYKDYAKVLNQSLKTEKDFIILSQLLGSLTGRYSNAPSVLFYSYYDTNLNREQKKKNNTEFENLIWDLLKKATPKSERQKILYSGYVHAAESSKAQIRLINLLTGKTILKGFNIDQDKRWEIILKLSSHDNPMAQELLEKEAKRDKSSVAEKMVIGANAISPNWDIKKTWIEEYLKDKSQYSFSQLKVAIYNLFPRHQSELRIKYINDFFKDLKWLNDNKDTPIASTFTALAPKSCNGTVPVGFENMINLKTLNPAISKALKIIRQENERCHAVLMRAML